MVLNQWFELVHDEDVLISFIPSKKTSKYKMAAMGLKLADAVWKEV